MHIPRLRGFALGQQQKIDETPPASAPSQTPPAMGSTDRSFTVDFHGHDAKPLPAASLRELHAHAQALGLPNIAGLPPTLLAQHIASAELQAGQKLDVRVSETDMARATTWAAQAQAMTPQPQQALFGFTRVVDRKLALTSALVHNLAAAVGDDDALVAAIESGPPGGDWAWPNPQNEVELVASLVRQMVRGAGASRQIVMTPPLQAWLDAALTNMQAPVKTAMGGAGAFAANLAQSLPNVHASFFSKDPLPKAIADRFAAGVSVVDGGGDTHKTAAFASSENARINTAAEYKKGMTFSIAGKTALHIGGALVPLVAGGDGRVIIGTQAKDIQVGFVGVSDDTLSRIALNTDMFFGVGAHYLTQGTASDAHVSSTALARAFDVMRAHNPKLLVHMQYVTPKVAANEGVVLRALRGHIDSFALNAVEVAPLADTLHDAELSSFQVDPLIPRTAAEDPAHMLYGALALQEGLQLKRVHIHGFAGDLVIASDGTVGGDDPQRQRAALLRARQLATNKAANDSGEIKSADDVWDAAPVVSGAGLAALHRFADAVQQLFDLNDDARDGIVERWYFRDAKSGRTFHFVPARGIHDLTGGSVSLGDTIDAAGLLFALHPKKRAVLPHGSSFP